VRIEVGVEPEVEHRRAESLALEVILEATRALLWISTRADARAIAGDVVSSLGGEMVPAGTADGDALPIDLSFGEGEPVVPRAPRLSVARLLMERHLPSLVEDIRRAVELGTLADRLVEDATIDSLTGLPNRRMLGRAIGRLTQGDVVIMVDLDHFKAVNDDLGHKVGDRVLQAVGQALRSTVRERDAVGRYGGEEFMVILRDGTDPEAFLERLRSTWVQVRPRPVTFSAGLARVVDDTTDAVQAADRALYQAKDEGRDRWAWAPEDDPARASASEDRVRPRHERGSRTASR
jgi:diguanylate cyclase (GGDEF)-like protein